VKSKKNRKLNYAHTRKPFPVASPKELVLFLGKMNLHVRSKLKFQQKEQVV